MHRPGRTNGGSGVIRRPSDSSRYAIGPKLIGALVWMVVSGNVHPGELRDYAVRDLDLRPPKILSVLLPRARTRVEHDDDEARTASPTHWRHLADEVGREAARV